MKELKFYVFLSKIGNGVATKQQLVRVGFMSENVDFVKCKTINKNGRYENKYSEFTKSELAEVMDGALYKSKQYVNDWIDTCECSSCEFTREKYGEWINPLIELVPVESEDK